MVEVREDPGVGRVAFDDLGRRLAGEGAMALCLAAQRRAPERSPLAALFGSHVLTLEARAWYLTALAERTSGRVLESLDAEYVVLHSLPDTPDRVPMPGSGLAHVVVGPMGVLVVSTKRCPDQRVVASVGSRHAADVAAMTVDARAAATRVAAMLAMRRMPAVPVTPVVAAVGAIQVAVEVGAVPHALVTDVRRLAREVAAMPAVLDHEAAWRTATVLRSASAWSDEMPDGDGSVAAAFAVLDRSVRAARLARVAWALALCGGIAVAAVLVAEAVPGLL
ncbi:NERD domain-containing protein [Curtobacterium ammoniigenes]|uniref:NERD domain-containing protein n=1 Tax=Curtobacterium ammoniigenes TaxID=395387 RepID=UPI00082F84C2|nr:NERD domain-containing protein [Curtobacterium ammoniigenes]